MKASNLNFQHNSSSEHQSEKKDVAKLNAKGNMKRNHVASLASQLAKEK